MKKRGVKRLAAAGQPLQILAEGDSGFGKLLAQKLREGCPAGGT